MQKINRDVPTFDTFPLFPANSYSESQCDLLIGIETALSVGMKRMQVLTEMALGNLPLVLTNLERLLQHTGARRVLLLLSSPRYEERVKSECEAFQSHGGQPFSHLFEMQHGLALPETGGAQVYVSTIRKVYAQVKRWERETALTDCSGALCGMFDVVAIFDHLSASLMWRTVLDAFDCATVAYCSSLDLATLDMLGRCVVCTRYAKPDVEHVLRDLLDQEDTLPVHLPCPDSGQFDQTASDRLPSRSGSRVLFSLPCREWRSGHEDAEGFARLYHSVEAMAMPHDAVGAQGLPNAWL